MTEFVALELKRNRGWPWPETAFGLDPMFRDDGWCHDCGMPLREQCGPVTLQRKGMATAAGAWVPYWRYDIICLEQSLADQVADAFSVQFMPVAWRGFEPGSAQQIVIPTVGSTWFDEDELRAATIARHGSAGALCSGCSRWRWFPLSRDRLPAYRLESHLEGVDIAASPEWFGDGWKSFREVVMRRELAELISKASPRDFRPVEITAA